MATKTPPKTAPTKPSTTGTDDGGSVVLERRTQKVKPPQMYQVLMLNDDYTPMEFVVVIIQEFFAKDRETATQIMLKIHLDGKGVCGVYSRDDQGGPGSRGGQAGRASVAMRERAGGITGSSVGDSGQEPIEIESTVTARQKEIT
jgi:ATP-dependent Clp protease adaptor protein ClpS